jgi:hypothetical protein
MAHHKKAFRSAFFLLFTIFVLNNPVTFAQETEESSLLNVDFGADIVSRYVWRGIEFGGDPAVPQFQPFASLAINIAENHSFTIGAWGSYGFTGDYNENDLSLKYSFSHPEAGTFSLTVNDYYYPYLGLPFTNFEDDGNGAHTIETGFIYTGPGTFPVSFLVSKNVKNDLPDNESLYIEAGFSTAVNDVALSFFAGAAKGISAWHLIGTDKFEFCNVGVYASKSIKITSDYSLPAGISWIYNPHLKKTYLVFKVSLY